MNPRLIDHARLSEGIYRLDSYLPNSLSNGLGCRLDGSPSKWQTIIDPSRHQLPAGFSNVSTWVNSEELTHGYRGAAFINHETKQVIIVHQGSDSPLVDPGDWYNNANHALNRETSFFPFGWSNQLQEAESFTKSVLNDPAFSQYQVQQTGHSLGGFLASVLGAKYKLPATAFDSPPSLKYLEMLKEKGIISQDQLDFAKVHTNTILSKGSFVDGFYNPDDYHGNIEGISLGLGMKENHSMNNILDHMYQNPQQYSRTSLGNDATSSASPSASTGIFADQLRILESLVQQLEKQVN